MNPIVHFDQVDLGHCLRTDFTIAVIRALLHEKQSLNITGGTGTGKTRLLRDIVNCNLAGVRIVSVDLRQYAGTHDGLLIEMASQLNHPGETPARLIDFNDLIASDQQTTLFFLDNYDALLTGEGGEDGEGGKIVDPVYRDGFFFQLTQLERLPNCQLLCTTAEPYHTLAAMKKKDLPDEDPLPLDPEALEPLTRSQAIAELRRNLDEYGVLWMKTSPDDKNLMLEAIGDTPNYYPFLLFLATQINGGDYEDIKIPFHRKLHQWQKVFAEKTGIQPRSGIGVLNRLLIFVSGLFK